MPENDDGQEPAGGAEPEGGRTGLELLSVILLSITAVLTAWSGFESSKWGGEMSIAFAQASTARVQSSMSAAHADSARSIDVDVFILYVEAEANGDEKLSQFIESRFTDHFADAFNAWAALNPLTNPDAPKSPFSMLEYRPPGQVEARDANDRADELFEKAVENNQRGDNYTLLTVLFALVLFFGAVAPRMKSPQLSTVVLVGAIVFMFMGVGFLISFPKIV